VQMDEVTQQNAALVEEATAASQSLESEAGRLLDIVSVFRLRAGNATAVAASAPASVRAAPRLSA